MKRSGTDAFGEDEDIDLEAESDKEQEKVTTEISKPNSVSIKPSSTLSSVNQPKKRLGLSKKLKPLHPVAQSKPPTPSNTVFPKITKDSDTTSKENSTLNKNDELPKAASSVPKPSSFKTPLKPTVPTTGLKSKTAPKSSTTTKSEVASSNSTNQENDSKGKYYKCMYCKRSNKKHKTYSDGILIVRGNVIILKDTEGKDLGRTASYSVKTLESLIVGSTLDVGQNSLEVGEEIPSTEYMSGKIFLQEKPTVSAPVLKSTTSSSKQFKSHFAPSETKQQKAIQPLFNPNTPNALVLYSPDKDTDSDGKARVAVVVDPHLSCNMRPHQKEGVKFMFDCVMGFREGLIGNGCILADEMGLGKTLQAIALILTLLKQGPRGIPVLKNEKVLVITPASLVQNWVNEIKKWLSSAKLSPLAVSETSKAEAVKVITKFVESSSEVAPLLIISYEQFRQHSDALQSIACGLVICDEGHRLKNSNIKTSKVIDALSTKRRVILSGTPIQNDLEEFYSMCNFCNPNVLGTYQSFRQNFAVPIMQGQEPNATKLQKEEGEARSKTLSQLTSTFILRRTAAILNKYLPPKVEQVVLCPLTNLQIELYKKNLNINSILSGAAEPLSCITKLKKICNHPALLYSKGEEDEQVEFQPIKNYEDFDPLKYQPEYSGKFTVLDALLKHLKSETSDRIVMLSHSTKTLNLFEMMCKNYGYLYLRLDGSTQNDQRQKMVDSFNESNSKYFAFLLSTKAGGVGLNLIGANRLVLFDSDWNPAHDKQAMARVWRDGQKKNVWIYRLLSTGTIEEKIFQRQITKQGLSSTIVDGKASNKKGTGFTKEELKDIFTLNVETICDTHDLLDCECMDDVYERGKAESSKKKTLFTKEETEAMHELNNWGHSYKKEDFLDAALQTVPDDAISFVFSMQANDQETKSNGKSSEMEIEDGE